MCYTCSLTHSIGACQELALHGNMIGDDGLVAFANAITPRENGKGVMAQLQVLSQTRCMQTANVSDEMHAMGKSSPAILPAYGNLRLMSLVRTLVVRDVVC